MSRQLEEKTVVYKPNFLASRRTFARTIAAAPLVASLAAKDAIAGVRGRKEDIYRRIGVRPLINARGTWTYLSGSLELPEVRQAKQEAAMHFVDIFELQRGVGRRLAELSGAESGIVTSGAAGAMAAATAACIAGTDPKKVWQLPDTTGLKSEVIMFGGRNAFDSAIRLAGGKLVVARTHEELERALNENTAMVYTTALGERLEKALTITKKAGVPLLLDDAAGIPPIENLSLYARMGVDLYTFSGGKGLAGPQCSGLLLGRKDLIEAALANCSPWEGAVCRAMKVGKEEIMGCLAAVEAWKKKDLNALNKEWGARVGRIAKLVETVDGVTTDIRIPEGGNRYPTLTVKWDETAFAFSVADCVKQLSEGEPRIEVLSASNPSMVPAVHEEGDNRPRKREGQPARQNRLQIVPSTLQSGEDVIVGKRLRSILAQARSRAAKRG
ncbi:MAG: aminotransferase class V-fold PLP-dependent enzyme [Acidobacteriales bacterium]|nr:aminotransferase class V-fold PLP-dependent enzyme [Terriglobales bacterium]